MEVVSEISRIVKWGADWMTEREFEEKLRSSSELAVKFDGEFSYDEDEDNVHPREFRDDFNTSDDVAVVLKHDGSILSVGNTAWPGSLTKRQRRQSSNVAAYVVDIIRREWGRVWKRMRRSVWLAR